MVEFFRRHALFVASTGLLIVSFQLASISVNDRSFAQSGGRLVSGLLAPVEMVYHEFSESTKYIWTHYVWLRGVEQERNELRERVKELEAQNSRLLEFQRENERLRQLVSFSEKTGYYGVAASVIGRDPSNWVRTIAIDRGADDGIRPGMPVVDGNGLVGQTTVVNSSSARVLLITDSSSAVDSIMQTSRATGIVEGGLTGELLRMRYVDKLQAIPLQTGERVITSGLDGVFPKGIVIGVVQRVDPSVSGMFQLVEVQPTVDMNRLENVMVLIPGAATAAAESPAAIEAPAAQSDGAERAQRDAAAEDGSAGEDGPERGSERRSEANEVEGD